MSTEEYSYPLFDENGKVNCQICGKPFMVISPRHLSGKHKIQYGEYKLRFPDSIQLGDITKTQLVFH